MVKILKRSFSEIKDRKNYRLLPANFWKGRHRETKFSPLSPSPFFKISVFERGKGEGERGRGKQSYVGDNFTLGNYRGEKIKKRYIKIKNIEKR